MNKIKKIGVLGLLVIMLSMVTLPVYAQEQIRQSQDGLKDEVKQEANQVVSQEVKQDAPQVKLTPKQKSEMAKLYKGILDKEKEIIAKYVQYKVISEKQGKLMTSHVEKRYNKIESSGFIPNWGKHRGKDKHRHDK